MAQDLRARILIADENPESRSFLKNILLDLYEVVEVSDGTEVLDALPGCHLLLLSAGLNGMDGFSLLGEIHRRNLTDSIPVIMLFRADGVNFLERAYKLGISDYLEEPLDPQTVIHRVQNAVTLFGGKQEYAGLAARQMHSHMENDSLTIAILSHVTEFHNGEGSLHIMHMMTLTRLLLQALNRLSSRYNVDSETEDLISEASALHDIGKISIPEDLLNKPGKLSPGEYELIKTHAAAGARFLTEMPINQQEPLLREAYAICRWHHERWDGSGYPDGLAGDDIPLSAQVVGLADTYDVLTSERCYKKAVSHSDAIRMITAGECGSFNPVLLDCLRDIQDALPDKLKAGASEKNIPEVSFLSKSLLYAGEASWKRQLEFLMDCSKDMLFAWDRDSQELLLSDQAAAALDLPKMVRDPMNSEAVTMCIGRNNGIRLLVKLRELTPEQHSLQFDLPLPMNQVTHKCRLVVESIWEEGIRHHMSRLLGRVINLDDALDHFSQNQNAQVRMALADILHAEPSGPSDFYRLSVNQVWELMRSLHVVFENVRLVDSSLTYQLRADADGRMVRTDMEEQEKDASTAEAIRKKSKLARFDFLEEKIFHVLSMYLEMDGEPFALEIVSRVTNESLMNGRGNWDLVNFINESNRKLYEDPVTGVSNRRLFEDQLSHLDKVDAVAMIDVDNFKSINDTYGHQFGDLALKTVAQNISRCIRSNDALIRYGGDEFAIIFRTIPKDVLPAKLEQIRAKVNQIVLMQCPDLRFSVSLGGAFGPNSTCELLRQADGLLYEAKKKKNAVAVND